MTYAQPATVDELRERVCAWPRVLARGGGTKPALSTPHPGTAVLDLSRLTGVSEYESAEFTFTALAGTRLDEVDRLLARHGQYLPFDPPLAGRGATLGGTVAAGLSGPGRYQFGGVRDFLLGVRYVNGDGEVIRGGGRVVKNAAGYDLPKLMVGSLGQFGILFELTFKVLPRPEAAVTAVQEYSHLDAALPMLSYLCLSSLEINAIDLQPTSGGVELWVRLVGLASGLPSRLERLCDLIGECRVIGDADEEQAWRRVREMEWVPPGWALVKVPLTPRRIPRLEQVLASLESLRRYSGGGQLLWLATPAPLPTLHERLSEQGLSGLILFGPSGSPRLGVRAGAAFELRVKGALDPARRFVEV